MNSKPLLAGEATENLEFGGNKPSGKHKPEHNLVKPEQKLNYFPYCLPLTVTVNLN